MVDRTWMERLLSPPKVVFFSFCFFVLSLYGPYIQFNNVAIMFMGGAWIYAGNYRNLGRLWKNKVALGILCWYVYQVATVCYSVNKPNAYKWMEYRSPLFYLPLLIGTSSLSRTEIFTILRLFAWVTALAAFVAIIYGSFMVIHTGDTGYLYNDCLGLLYDKQAVYLAMYVNLAIAIFLFMISGGGFVNKLYRNLAVCSVLFLIGFMYLLACRTALLILVLLLLGYLFYLIFRQKRYMTGAILILGMFLAGIFSFSLFPKAASRLLFVTQTSYTFESKGESDHFNGEHKAENWNSVNTRLAVWACSREVIAAHWLIGTGIGDSEDALISQYKLHHFEFAAGYRLNSHNQYLDATLTCGVLGLLVFVPGIILLPLLSAWKSRNRIFLFLIGSLVIYMLTEVMLSRNQGIAFIAFFMCLMSLPYREES